jgi:RNA polymerase sigma factor (TIGR02999 family)
MKRDAADVTRLLHRWRTGDPDAADHLLAATYAELRRMARGFFRHERGNHTLQPTALVHEAYLRLFKDQPVDVESRDAFFRLIAAQMRRHLVDHARRHRAAKRGGGIAKTDFDDVAELIPATDERGGTAEEVFAQLEQALGRLGKDHPRAAEIVQLRYFADQSNEEIAARLRLSVGTVKRDFAFARSWLARELKGRDF